MHLVLITKCSKEIKAALMTNEQLLPGLHEQDPLVGEEILRVSLESSGVYVHLTKSQLQISSDFFVRKLGDDDQSISPKSKVGSMSALWSILGDHIIAVIWGNELVVKLDSGAAIVIPPSASGYRGTILTEDGSNTAMEDF